MRKYTPRAPRVVAPPKQQPESPIVYACLKYLLDKGYFVWRNNVGGCKAGKRWLRFGLKGSSDIIGMTNDGRFLGVEVKTATGDLSIEQAAFIARVNASGGVAMVARSVNDLIVRGL